MRRAVKIDKGATASPKNDSESIEPTMSTMYAEVLVGDAAYHGSEPLTYASTQQLLAGSLVVVPVRQKKVLGIVVASGTHKPSFSVKPIFSVPSLARLPSHLLELIQWMREYYPAPLGIVTQHFLPRQLPKKAVEPLVLSAASPALLPTLTSEQTSALSQINSKGLHILHGETGSGKTRVYIELAKRSLAEGKSAIILTPEIGLTSQLANDFRKVFGERVIIVHSQLSEVTRQKKWVQMLEHGEPLVVIGARSALFVPLRHVGLIVVDEAHETAYKQEQAPYYHTTRIAAKLIELQGAIGILGSATPLINDYYIAEAKDRPIIRMTQTATTTATSEGKISVVDLRDRTQFTKRSPFSDQLIEAMEQTLARQEQVLLFLNRRGTARIIFCEHCGWQATCPHCDLPLVYHGDSHLVRCHTCIYQRLPPNRCSNCYNNSIVFKTIGTKAITDEVHRLFPEASAMRFDNDNKKSERIEQHYTALHSGKVDIIIGTQTLAKGLDLPKLGLVGVIIADTSLYFPDFTAQERTYQLLSQVLGRIGRGHRAGGQAIVQTYAPDSFVLQAVLAKDWKNFYQAELVERRKYNFPPFCHLLKLMCRRGSSQNAEKSAKLLLAQINRRHPNSIVEGPTPAFHERINNKYQWQLIVKARERQQLVDIIKQLPANWLYDIDPMNLL